MFILDGIAYAKKNVDVLQIENVKILDNYMLLVVFNNNEEKLFDCEYLFTMPVFKKIKCKEIFNKCKILYGTITWLDGEIDIAPETVYEKSYKYEKIV